MKRGQVKRRLFLGSLAISLFFLSCVSSNDALLNYNHDLLMGILWQQNSGEYPALCYQAFNHGKQYILTLPEEGKKAVVLDLDETVLDNSKYAAWMVSTASPWSASSWEAWCNAAEAGAVPGSLDFALFVKGRKIEVFYVSNRPASAAGGTITNLQNLGFPMADEDHVLLQKDTSDKAPRLEQIRTAGYEIVLFAGDSLEDFDSSTRKWSNAERSGWVKTQIEKFGSYWIVLPNAVYGTFESAVRPDYYGLSFKEKAEARLVNIESWQPAE
jgi:5'-nucleotidase (lipoprotein e(P4) family)